MAAGQKHTILTDIAIAREEMERAGSVASARISSVEAR
jgi:hypothetical protein